MIEAATPAAEEVLRDESASEWLKSALRSALDRNPVDALNDALLLSGLLEERVREELEL